MRDRAKIIVNNREVKKRYLGSRLVWEAEPALRLIFQKDNVTIYEFFVGYLLEVGNNNIPENSVTHIQINNKEIFKLKTEKLINLPQAPTMLMISENEVGLSNYFETASWGNNGNRKKVVSLKLYTSE
jgi:hypothetical protein|nr:MAG TPA: hypothetical protein [Caudoviricetes sp.]